MRLNAWCCAWCTHMPRHEPHVWFDLAHLPPRWHCEPSIASQGIHHHFDSGRDGVVAGAENRRRCPPCGDVCAGTRHDRFVRTTPKLADIGTCRDLGKAENSPSTKIRLSRMKAGSRINVKNDKCAQAISTNPTMRRVTRCAVRPRLVSCAIAPHHPVRADRTPAAGAHWARAHPQVASSRQSSPTAGSCLRHPPG